MTPICRHCSTSLDYHDRAAGVHWTCAKEAANRAADYGPHVRPGARCMHLRDSRVGRVLRIEDGCHWGRLQVYDDLWRPRAAYVLIDGDRGARDEVVPGGYYWPPEDLSVVPEHWAPGAGVFGGTSDRTAERTRPFGPTVIRPLRGELHLMDRQEGGFAARSYGYPTLSALLDAWAVIVGERGHDEHGALVHVSPEEVTQ